METPNLIVHTSKVHIPLTGPTTINHLNLIQQRDIILSVNTIVPVGEDNICFEEHFEILHLVIYPIPTLTVEHIVNVLIHPYFRVIAKNIKENAEGVIHHIGNPEIKRTPSNTPDIPAPTLLTSVNPISAEMSSSFKYTILSGDTFNIIASNLQTCKGLTINQVSAANPSVDPTKIAVGQVINIPNTTDGTTALKYTIQSGDYYALIVENINKSVGISASEIQAANPTITPQNLQIGEVINIPPHVAAVVAPITVKTSDEENNEATWQLDINHTTLADLKHKIQDQFKIPVDLQSIGSSTLAPFDGDSKLLTEFGINAGGASLGVMSHGMPVQDDTTAKDYKVIVYFPSWGIYERQFFLPAIDFSMVTHLNYAFANMHADGTVFMPDPSGDAANFKSLKDIKNKYPKLKTMLSIGGWSYSSNFSAIAASETSRQKFVSTAIKIMKDNGFDGLDIDWEFPVQGGDGIPHSPADKTNFTLLLQDLRNGLGSTGLLTITAPPRPSYHQNFEVDKIKNIVDWVSLMSYDYHGQWQDAQDAVTNFNAPLYEAASDPNDVATKHDLNINASVCSLLNMGLPSKQLVLGLSFYGRGFKGVEAGPDSNGLFQKWTGVPGGTWNDGSGVYDWWDISDNFIGKGDWQQYYHAQSQAAWLYSPSKKMFIAYDDPRTIWSKCAYVVSHQLGGTMAWDASSDRYNQLLYVANNALSEGGIEATGGPIPKSDTPAQGAAWSDQDAANKHSAPISAIDFSFTKDGIIGLRTEYGTEVSPWRGSSKGTISRMIIPADRYITQFDISTAEQGVTFKAIRVTFDNGTAFSIGMGDGAAPQYSVGTCKSFLFYLHGKATDDQLTELSFQFNSLPASSSAIESFYSIENMDPSNFAYQIVQAKGAYLNNYTGSVSAEALDNMPNVGAYYDSPHFSFTVGSADCHYDVLTDGGIGYSMGLQLQSVHAQLVIGDPNDPSITIEYDGPEFSYGLEEEASFKDGQASVKFGNAAAGMSMSVGKNGFKLDSTLDGVGETFEIDKNQIKIGITEDGITEGLEINKNGIGVYFGIGGFTIDITVINIKVLKALEEDYIELGKYIWNMAPLVFKAIASAFVHATQDIANFFKSLFHL